MVAVVLGHDAGVAQHRRQPRHDGRAALEHGLAVLVGGGGVLGEQRAELVELLEVERPEVGVLEPPDGLELGRGVHGCTPFGPAREGRGQGSCRRSWRVDRRGPASPAVPEDTNASASPPTASAATPRGGCCWPGPRPPHPAGALVPPRGRRPARRGPDRLAAPGDRGGIGADGHRRAAARRALRRAHDPRRHQPAHRPPHLPGGVLGGHAAARGRRDDRRRRLVQPRRGRATCRWPTTSRRSWSGSCERAPDEIGAGDHAGTTSSSSAAASAGSSPPAPSSGRRSGSPSSTGRTTTSSSPCSTRWPPASSRRARSRRPSATSCANYPTLRVVLGEVARHRRRGPPGPRRRVRQAAHHRLRQPHRRRRGHHLLLRPRRVPRLLVRHEDARRRPGAAGRHLRRLRAGRGRDRTPTSAGAS